MTTKLYLLTQDYNNGWGVYTSAVVCATSKWRAKHMHPGDPDKLVLPEGEDKHEDIWGNWCPLEYVNAKYLGIGAPGLELGVICASFNAG